MKVTGNVSLVRPRPQHPHFWATAKDPDTLALRDLGSVMFGWQTRPDDETIEKTVRRWCFERNFTGYDQLDVGQELYKAHLAWNVVQWLRSYQHVNEGRGPTIGCTTLAVAYVGLLVGQGIPSRVVHGAHGEGSLSAYTAVDNAAEVWSTRWGKWMLVVPHCCFHLERESGEPVSFLELVTEERAGTPNFKIVPLVGNGTARHTDFNPNGWRDYVDVAKYHCGNRTVLRDVPSEREMWYWLQPLPPLSGDTIGPEETMDCEPQDVLVTLNALQITAEPIGKAGKRARIKAEHTMIDNARLIVSSEWTSKEQDELETIITLKEGNAFRFRMFSKELGSTSNTVTVDLRKK